jgi:hypothetical protein
MAPKTGAGDDPLQKLQKLIDDSISAAFESRDQAEKEKSDPKAWLSGEIDRTVARHFQAFRDGLEASEEEAPKPKPKAKPEGGGFLESLGITGGAE